MRTTANKKLDQLYPEHIRTIQGRYDEALTEHDYDAVVIGAGIDIYRFLDDLTHPFRANPHFLQWVPVLDHPGSALIYQPGQKPELLLHEPETFWHASSDLPGGIWQQHVTLRSIKTPEDLAAACQQLPNQTAYLGDVNQWQHSPAAELLNPEQLLTHLHYYRPFRTDYEVACIRLATIPAVAGHRAAEDSFRAGATEFEILMSFLNAAQRTENELPYPAIIARNEHGATLHYQHYDRTQDKSRSLLIDAGCDCNGYASDITRTHAYADAAFKSLIQQLDTAQQRIADAVAPGKAFVDLHHMAHREVAGILETEGLVNMTPDQQLEEQVTQYFFPHGLGHFLGLQVHEVGGSYSDTRGTEPEKPDNYPNLRLVRTLEAGQVLTIEPGLYFIDSLLSELSKKSLSKSIDWERVEYFRPFGGIRIEDNLLITDGGNENITRNAF